MRASGYERVQEDWYCEPGWLVDAVIAAEELTPGLSCWDPSAGGGNIPKRLKARGIECFATDLVDRGYCQGGVDFFKADGSAEVIITNPPYGVLQEYVRHALYLASDRVIVLARLAFLEGQRRRGFFATTPLARVWVSSRRASMPPGGSDTKPTGGAIAYAWFVFEHGHVGPPTLGWV